MLKKIITKINKKLIKYIYINKKISTDYNICLFVSKIFKNKITENKNEILNKKLKKNKLFLLIEYNDLIFLKKREKELIERRSKVIFVNCKKNKQIYKIEEIDINFIKKNYRIKKIPKLKNKKKIFSVINHLNYLKYYFFKKYFKFVYKENSIIDKIIKKKNNKKDPISFIKKNNKIIYFKLLSKLRYKKISKGFPFSNVWNFIILEYSKLLNK